VSENVDLYSVLATIALSVGSFEFGRVRGFDKGYEYAWKEIVNHGIQSNGEQFPDPSV
jgi:hypothetical protein